MWLHSCLQCNPREAGCELFLYTSLAGFFFPDAASKHAVMGFFDCLRAEVEEYDVVVSTVSPTFIHSYQAYPEQRNWGSSICKCKRSEETLSLGVKKLNL